MSTTQLPGQQTPTAGGGPPPRATSAWVWIGSILGLIVIIAAAVVAFGGGSGDDTTPVVTDEAAADSDEAATSGMHDEALEAGDTSIAGVMEPGMHDDDQDGHGGAAADQGGAAEVIEIEMTEFAYGPDMISVEAGTPVVLRFTNTGAIEHEAMVGDAHMQEEFAAMGGHGDHGGGGHHGDVMAITVPAGGTADLEVVFDDSGEVLVGCHLPGHYDAGMVATINVA